MLKPRQREMFLLTAGGHLQDDGPRPQGVLKREEDPPGRPAAELGHEPEPAQSVPDFREGGGGPLHLHQALTVEEELELGTPIGEPIHDLGRQDLEARFLTQAYFFMDQPQHRFSAQLGMAVEKRLGRRPLTAPPRGHHLFNELRCERARTGTASTAGIDTELELG